jgi:hypothetical protein
MKNYVWLCASLLAIAGCNRLKSTEAAADPSGATIPPVPEVSLPAGTTVRVRLIGAIDTRRNRVGDKFTASLDEPLVVGDRVIVPKGTSFSGHVIQSNSSGRFKGRAVLGLMLDSFDLDGQIHEIQSGSTTRTSAGHKKHNWLWIGGGSGGGAAIGAIAGGGAGALIGAGAGAAGGTIGSVITGKREVSLPAETPLTFTLQESVEVGKAG